LAVELTTAHLEKLREGLKPLLRNVEQINLDTLRPELPRLRFEPETIEIPAGPFLMGSTDGEAHETPQHEVNLPTYQIGKYPITNAEYAEFVKREKNLDLVPKKVGWFGSDPPPDKLNHPVVGVSWYDAQAYCHWLSQQTNDTRRYRLPTEAEWEKAASWLPQSGGAGVKRKYPWGDEFEDSRCNSAKTGLDVTTPAGCYSPQGDSPWGCADMAGNIQEWTSTLWTGHDKNAFSYPYQANDGREDLAADQSAPIYRVHRGGSFHDDPIKLRCAARGQSSPDSKLRWRGFRVVLEI
jgi:iron(II)-dependent oxidoreductase